MLALLNTLFAYAINGRTTYQARIIKPDGLPLQSSSVNFRFTVLDQSGSCVLYVEDYAAINMTDTSGLISFPLGTGARTFPTSGTSQTFQNTFDNSITSFACQTMGIYNPNSTDTRKIVMQFNDGNGWQTLPAMSVNAVPYAMFATRSDNSRALNGKADTAFVEYSTLNSLGCAADQAIKYNGVSFSCITVGSSGTAVTSSTVIAALGYTPAQGTSFTSLDSTVTSVSSAVYSVSSTVSNLNNSVTSLSNSVAASFAAITSSQWLTSGTSVFYNSGNVGIGTSAPTTKLDVAGGIRISMEAATCAVSFAGTLRYNSGSVEYCNGAAWLPFGVAGSGITSLNSSTSSTQTFATGITGTVFNISSVNGVHTFNIPLAASSSVIAGLLSNADYQTFTNKVSATSASVISALGYTPVNATSASVISALGYTPASATGLGALASLNYLDLSSSLASGTLSVANLPSVGSSVTSGTQYTKVTVDGKGRVISGSQVTLNDIVHVYTANGGLFVGSGTSRPLVDDANTAESTAFGVNSMAANQSGGQNTAFGFATLESSVTSYENAAFGWYALQANTTGQFNTAIGAETMWGNTTGVENTAVGGAALQDLTTGNYNSALGMVAGGNITNGSENVFIGIGAGRGATNANVSKNTIVGGWAGSVINTGADNNVILGYQSGGNLTTGSSNILIGYNVNAVTATASQTLNIGNIIFGSGLNGVSQNISSGSIGIGIKTPTAKLHLTSGTASMAPLKFSSGTLLASPQSGTMEYDGFNFYVTDGSNQRRTIATGSSTGSIDNASTINSSGNITLTPTGSVIVSSTTASTSYNNGALVVQGGVGIAGDLNVAGTISGSAQVKATGYRANQGAPNAADSSTNGYSFGADGDTGMFSPGSGGANGVIAFYNNDIERVRIDPTGNVGIGTSTPLKGLHVSAGEMVGTTSGFPAVYANVHNEFNSGSLKKWTETSGNSVNVGAYSLVAPAGTSSKASHSFVNILFTDVTAGTSATGANNGFYNFTVRNRYSGNTDNGYVNQMVGIRNEYGHQNDVPGNTPSTGSIYGSLYAPQVMTGTVANLYDIYLGSLAGGGTVGQHYSIYQESSTAKNYFGGYVGIGTSNPSTILDVAGLISTGVGTTQIGGLLGSNRGVVPNAGLIVAGNTGSSNGGYAQFYGSNAVSGTDDRRGNVDIGAYSSGGTPGNINFYTYNGSSWLSRMMIQGTTGNIGIGTAAPTSKLSIYSGNDGSMDSVQIHGGSLSASRYGVINVHDTSEYIRLGYYNGTAMKNIFLDGSVGIGTTSPSAKLEVTGNVGIGDGVAGNSRSGNAYLTISTSATANRRAGIQFKQNNTNTFELGVDSSIDNTNNFYIWDSVSATTRFVINASGNVGIGTTAPSAKLEVTGGVAATFNSTIPHFIAGNTGNGTSDYNYILQGNNDTGTKAVHFVNSSTRTADGAANSYTIRNDGGILRLGHGGYQTQFEGSSFYFNAGSVGIGTASPAYKLDVSGDIRAANLYLTPFPSSGQNNSVCYNSTWGIIGFCTSLRATKKDIQDLNLGLETILKMRPVTFHWKSGGFQKDLGFVAEEVEAVNPLLASYNDDGRLIGVRYNQLTALLTKGVQDLKKEVDLSVRYNYDGNVGIGTTAPSYKLDVNGTIRGFGITDSSDIRLKKNVMPLDLSLEKILQIEGVSYNWIDKERSEKKQIGFIAQQLEKIYPELVETDKQGMKSVNYSHLVAPLVEAFKALYEKVSGVEREIASLKAENEELKSKVKEFDELKAYICKKDPEAPNCKPAQ